MEHSEALQALVYRWIQSVDPKTSQELHDSNGPKPIAITPLVPIGEGEVCVGIACLDDKLTKCIRAAVLLNDAPIGLKAKDTHHSYALDTEVDLVAQADWGDFVRAALPSSTWQIDLLSPTACKILKRVAPAPSAVAYFNSWLTRWNTFSPIQLPAKEILAFVEARVDIIELEGHTERVFISPQENPYPGFIGSVTFAVNKPTSKDAPQLKTLDTLITFATYSGTGVQTMRGMGTTQTKALEPLVSRPPSKPGNGVPDMSLLLIDEDDVVLRREDERFVVSRKAVDEDSFENLGSTGLV
jgi:CRISPR/Cas system endoribonuclease Cas6 (RAMP superfamily)